MACHPGRSNKNTLVLVILDIHRVFSNFLGFAKSAVLLNFEFLQILNISRNLSLFFIPGQFKGTFPKCPDRMEPKRKLVLKKSSNFEAFTSRSHTKTSLMRQSKSYHFPFPYYVTKYGAHENYLSVIRGFFLFFFFCNVSN